MVGPTRVEKPEKDGAEQEPEKAVAVNAPSDEEVPEALVEADLLDDLELLGSFENTESGCRTALLPVVSRIPELSSLRLAVRRVAEVQELLSDGDAELTLFAPINKAFDDVLDELGVGLELLLAQKEIISAILSYHVVPDERLTKEDVRAGDDFSTALPGYALFGGSDQKIEGLAATASFVGEAVILCRSVIYLVDSVLLPEPSMARLRAVFLEATSGPRPAAAVRCRQGFNAFFAITSDADLSRFTDLITTAQLSGPLAEDSVPLTVFAPTDRAIDGALDELEMTIDELKQQPKILEDILKYHIIRGKNWKGSQIKNGPVETWNGTDVNIRVDEDIVLTGIGSNAVVSETDIDLACSAAVHKINNLLLPFREAETTPTKNRRRRRQRRGRRREQSEQSCQFGSRDLFSVVSSSPGLTFWSEIIRLAGLQGTFADRSVRVTMFAPSDAAFEELLISGLEFSDMVGDVALAQALVSYHTVEGAETSNRIKTGSPRKTFLTNAGGNVVEILVDDYPEGSVDLQVRGRATAAEVVETDILGCNSVVHIIDTVLQPYADFFPSEEITLGDAVAKAEAFGTSLQTATASGDQ